MKKKLLSRTILVAIMIAFGFSLSAQSTFLSLQVASDISGSGLGSNVCPNLALTFKRNTLSIGPNFQSRRMNLSGVQMNYRYSAAKNFTGKMELFFLGSVIRHEAAYLSAGNVKIEECSNAEVKGKCETMKLSVLEFYGGIGLKVNMSNRFNIAASSGIGMYHTFNKDYNQEMYRQKSAVVMQLRVLVIYNLVR